MIKHATFQNKIYIGEILQYTTTAFVKLDLKT